MNKAEIDMKYVTPGHIGMDSSDTESFSSFSEVTITVDGIVLHREISRKEYFIEQIKSQPYFKDKP